VTAPRVVLLTGRSDPARTGLPAAQSAFLAAVTPPGAVAIQDGYPWSGAPTEEVRIPLALAAWRNAMQWHAARTGGARAEVAARLTALRGGPLAIVTGSCGLDLLECGWVDGACGLVVALGPVMSSRSSWLGVRLITVVGRRDALSRVCHRERPDIRVPCGHMGYWNCPATQSAVAGALKAWAS
jgi:hypothetical protein